MGKLPLWVWIMAILFILFSLPGFLIGFSSLSMTKPQELEKDALETLQQLKPLLDMQGPREFKQLKDSINILLPRVTFLYEKHIYAWRFADCATQLGFSVFMLLGGLFTLQKKSRGLAIMAWVLLGSIPFILLSMKRSSWAMADLAELMKLPELASMAKGLATLEAALPTSSGNLMWLLGAVLCFLHYLIARSLLTLIPKVPSSHP